VATVFTFILDPARFVVHAPKTPAVIENVALRGALQPQHGTHIQIVKYQVVHALDVV